MLSENYTLDYISDLEVQSINNFVIKESFNIIQDEVDYFFNSKAYLMDVFIEGVDFTKLSPQSLQQRFIKVFYSQRELEAFLDRIEKRISSELSKSSVKHNFRLENNTEGISNISNSFSFIQEAAKTFNFSCSTVKAINTVWKKSSRGIVPKELTGLFMKLKVGEYFMSTVGLSPREIKTNIYNKISKTALALMKQNKHEITNLLKKQVITQIIASENLKVPLINKTHSTKTA